MHMQAPWIPSRLETTCMARCCQMATFESVNVHRQGFIMSMSTVQWVLGQPPVKEGIVHLPSLPAQANKIVRSHRLKELHLQGYIVTQYKPGL